MLNKKIYAVFSVICLWAALFTVGCGDDSVSRSDDSNKEGWIYDTVYVNDTMIRIDTLKNVDTLSRIDTIYVDSIIGVLVLNHDTIYLKDSSIVADTAKMKAVKSFKDLKGCFEEWEGNRVYTVTTGYTYVCRDEQWILDRTEPYALTNAEVTGMAQKGPFMFHSTIKMTELYGDSLGKTTRIYTDEVSGNKGDFVFPKVNLENGIVSLEATGRYYNEVTGVWTIKPITLQALVELNAGDAKKAARSKANINILTHLEYDRVLELYKKGYPLAAAKKQAQQEIMNAFGLPTKITNAEDLDLFSTANNNGELMTISLLFLRDLQDSVTAKEIADFRSDLAADGLWQNATQKAQMADWAYSFDKTTVRAAVASWNISEIASFETSMDHFWQNAYGIGECSSARYSEVLKNTNSSSANKDLYFICRNGSIWNEATSYEKDTYRWEKGEQGEIRKGNVTDSFYVYNGSWTYNYLQTLFQKCDSTKIGMILQDSNEVYHICRANGIDYATILEYNTYQWPAGEPGEVKAGDVQSTYYYYYVADSAWRDATTIEVDTYGWEAGEEGEVRAGSVYTDNQYVYDSDKGAWRLSNGLVEMALGACTEAYAGTVKQYSGSSYYICRSQQWYSATDLEKDTYQWEDGVDGDIKMGDVNTTFYYVWDSDIPGWRAASTLSSNYERYLGACTEALEGTVKTYSTSYYTCHTKSWTTSTNIEKDTDGWAAGTQGQVKKGNVTDTYYIYDTGAWRIATTLEYDTYGWIAGQDGDVKVGSINTSYYYVWDSDIPGWRAASTLSSSYERYLGACTEAYEGTVKTYGTSYYTCHGKAWTTSTNIEKDTDGWAAGSQGQVKKGDVTSAYYIYDSEAWRTATVLEYDTYDFENDSRWEDGVDGNVKAGAITANYYVWDSDIPGWRAASGSYESSLGACTEALEGTVKKYGTSSYYTCHSKAWTTSTNIEKDTDGWAAGSQGQVKKGNVTDTYYIYDTGAWRTATVLEYDTYDFENDSHWEDGVDGDVKAGAITANYYVWDSDIPGWRAASTLSSSYERYLGACTESYEGTVKTYSTSYYTCHSKAWTASTDIEKDTYGWDAGTEGEIKKGDVTDTYYIYDTDAWRVATDPERDTYGWEAGSEGEIKKGDVTDTYYIYDTDAWRVATDFDLDTQGWGAGTEGDVKAGEVNTSNYYVWDSDESAWREAKNDIEQNNGACTTNREGEELAIKAYTVSCTEKEWVRATFTDSRDGQKYTYVTIGTQTWMAENLNFVPTAETGQSWCYAGSSPVQSTSPCSERGRYYRWNAALNKTRSSCGYGSTCSYTTPIQGSCPTGWHIPTRAEWTTLINYVALEHTNAVYALSATTTWSSSYGTDNYGFSLKAYGSNPYSNSSFSNVGARAEFWTADQSSSNYGYYIYFTYSSNSTTTADKDDARPIRCVKN